MTVQKSVRYSLILATIGLFAGTAIWVGADENGERSDEARELPTLLVDENPVSELANGQPVSYADVLEQATPSVVGVVTTEVVSGRRGLSQEDYMRRLFGLPPAQEPDDGDDQDERRQAVGMGSGVIVSSDGYVITNNHVVRVGRSDELADEIIVQLIDGREFTAELVGSDERTDVAVLKIDVDEELPALTIADSDLLRVGDVCFAIGNPLRVGLTVTQGLVSALGRTNIGILGFQGYEDFIQTDAAINMGNSGGALVDANGRLIGINTAIISRTGGNIGIGLAIPSSLVRYVMESLIEQGEVPRGFLGVVPGDLTPELAEAWGLSSTKGALVRQVEPEGAAKAAGIEHRDIITEVDGRFIDSGAELRIAIAQTPPGETVSLKIIRDGNEITKEVTLGSLGERMASTPRQGEEGSAIEYLVLEELTDELRSEYSIPSSVEGVLIARIERVTPRNQDFEEGMVIVEINRDKVTSLSEVADSLREGINSLYVWSRETSYDYLTYEK
ncbi:MAG: Do family serine endopeptidase [Verrucomicrobiota bacterium]